MTVFLKVCVDSLVVISLFYFSYSDIDYHYSRSEIYVTLSDSTIVRYSVNISLMEESSTFTLTHTNTEVIFSQLGDGLGAITVDWVNDLLYWVQYDGNQSQVSRVNSSLRIYWLYSFNVTINSAWNSFESVQQDKQDI